MLTTAAREFDVRSTATHAGASAGNLPSWRAGGAAGRRDVRTSGSPPRCSTRESRRPCCVQYSAGTWRRSPRITSLCRGSRCSLGAAQTVTSELIAHMHQAMRHLRRKPAASRESRAGARRRGPLQTRGRGFAAAPSAQSYAECHLTPIAAAGRESYAGLAVCECGSARQPR